ncbi:PTS IIA-like nitrogen regulatory protein PtsN [Hyphomicrobium sulfonivorans]|uniref:PTS IIA-like nitrogen-regulatory protein PtsN n=1 Tax=Hyphomicrobium sulfonivorans TaxID=121290 RepID=A0A109BKM9_HYPSL|nr:PTS IIA-like nitrogen regulatory protein PtsN [Hyphomicrobium sulfonivorans]KWT70582.1 PTS IIA-like nitrogen-regulatory protein PtsN [Hyphomicrobium sulfonivorans]MBI1649566.1 PTS IIA-like nitrogen regulatory protein PtsN [Hyphomicrobium sulfonivorans]NSL71482.1 PTS IIA-like nitrogen-regulatory protein PtsN [Hyphomicrobium sulfonivorans]
MDLCDLLAPDGVIASLKASSKKDALEQLAAAAAEKTGLDRLEIFNTLLQRERLGSTGLGAGIAIPHVKLAGLTKIVCLFARLTDPIDFDSHDDQPVDLVFLLLAPEHASGDHLKALASISRLVREPSVIDSLRKAPDAETLRQTLTRTMPSHAA